MTVEKMPVKKMARARFVKKMLATVCFCLATFFARAQNRIAEYDAKWKTVDSLDNAGLPASALAVINRIYALAKQEHNDGQEIKALIYRVVVSQKKRENDDTAAIKELETAVAGAVQPSRSVLQSLLADEYRYYFQRNRWNIYNRATTIHFVKSDIATWSTSDFGQKISELYRASLQDEKLLERTGLENYGPIIIKGNVRYLRPTLFDLLAHEALDYFMNAETEINQPANVFELGDPAAFGDAAAFAVHLFATADTASLKYSALLLFQRLIRLHLDDANPDALIDVDIARLGFAWSNTVNDQKESLFRQALTRITGKYGDLPVAAEAWYLQAEQDNRLADDTQTSGDTTLLRGKVSAVAICQGVLARKDSSEGQTNCRILLHSLLKKELTVEVEKVNLPGKPMRALVSWRNFSRLQLRLIRLDRAAKEPENIENQDSSYWDRMLSLPAYRSFAQDLPTMNDYQTHRAEIAIASLPMGAYALISSTGAGRDKQQDVMTVQYLYVSSIAFISTGENFFVLNRESGQPIDGAAVQVWKSVYQQRADSYRLAKTESYQTDRYGYFSLKKTKSRRSQNTQYLEISSGNDYLFMTDQGLPYFPDESEETRSDKDSYERQHARAYLFLDRSIYRPGQTVYFKGIVVTEDYQTHQPKICPAKKAKLILYNANGEKTDSLDLTTNEFGSYHGSFRLPEHQLNGQFRVIDEAAGKRYYSDKEFSVEEYKRPAFFVEYDKPKDSYRLGDSISVTGNARAYAGNDLGGASVKYRIVRQVSYPHNWWLWRGSMPGGSSREIAHGELKTDARGAFHLAFAAIPDRSVRPSLDPRFSYEVTADVTDINGETRSGTTQIVAGYTAIDLSIALPDGDRLPADSLRRLSVGASNLSGVGVSCAVRVRMYPLRSPDRLIRERLWQSPDSWVISETVFRDSFPHDEYREETRKESWSRGPLVWETRDSTASGTVGLTVPAGQLSPGWYVIEAEATDQYGQDVKDLHYVELYNGKTGRPGRPEYDWVVDQHRVAQPGESVAVRAGSSAMDVYVIRMLNRDIRGKVVQSDAGDVASFGFITLNRERRDTSWRITDADRGGFGIIDAFVKDNRLFTHQTVIQVPWSNKELQIRYTTYRDKTLPGSGEKWAVTISGDKTEPAAAEVLTSMYDASLNQFLPQRWSEPRLYPVFTGGNIWQGSNNFYSVQSQEIMNDEEEWPAYSKEYDRLLSPGARVGIGRKIYMMKYTSPMIVSATRFKKIMVNGKMFRANGRSKFEEDDLVDSAVIITDGEASAMRPPDNGEGSAPQQVLIRRNFNETAFFFPDLRTDSAGNVSFSFTMPEALTQWKWMTLAHTRDLAFGYSEKTIVTQKQLMVQPNIPRFLREGDKINLSVKVVNLTDSEMTGQMGLALTDPTTGETADGWFVNRQPNQYFTVAAHGSAVVEFPLDIPFQYNRPLSYRIVAQAGAFSDGEEAVLPVVSNRMLVTETLPLDMAGDGTRSFRFDKLLQSGSSETLSNHALTVEFTANPAWYAVQALPYLMEFPYECAEQVFDRLYANALASKIVSSSPRIAQVFARWRVADTAALLSNLEKNSELKSVLLEETPWVLQGKTETQQKKNIALLFDTTRMSGELESAMGRLKELQAPDGGFAWFKGGPDDRYVTQYILTGIGHLQRLQALPAALAEKIKAMVLAALPFADQQIRMDYERELKMTGGAAGAGAAGGAGGGGKGGIGRGVGVHGIGQLAVQYLYMRSMFNDYGLPGDIFPAVFYYRKLARQEWVTESKYMQGMIALALFRTGDQQTGRNIIASLRQTAIHSEELGMYWKGMEGGYYWYQAPIETESLLIEAFREISGDSGVDRELKTWLLRQKQTHSWATTKATADAVYALLLGGQDWLTADRSIGIRLGDKVVDWGPGIAGAPAGEAGTGYNKKIFDAPFINPSMGNVTVTMRTRGKTGSRPEGSPAWGAVYWQYFDQLDRITPTGRGAVNGGVASGGRAASGGGMATGGGAALQLVKRVFVQRNTDRGPVLDTIPDGGSLKVGDRVVVRIELRADRDLEYVHLKDMRAACLEPVNVLSGYKWQGGLGYYETTKDASTEFFFPEVGRGTYVFEYTLVVGQTGEFSNGVSSVECMYAPEFAFHTEGIRINVEGGQ